VPHARATFQLFTEAFDPPDKTDAHGILPCRLCGSEHADHMQHLVHHCTAAAAVSARQEFADVVPLCALPQALTMASARSPDRLHRVATLCKRLLDARMLQYRQQNNETGW